MTDQLESKECRTCRAIGLVIAAILVGLITYYISKSAPIWVAILAFLILLAVGLWLVNLFCCRNETQAAPAAATPEATPEPAPEPAPAVEPEMAATPVAEPSIEPAATSDAADEDEGTDESARPEALAGPRDGKADDLKKIKGVGPKLEKLLNSLGFYHFDQVANWTAEEVAWVDANLEGFKGRVSRDGWVDQAKTLAEGGDTEFSKKVDKGDVY